MSGKVQRSGGFLAFLGWPSIVPHRNRGVRYTDRLRSAGKLDHCDDLHQKMQQDHEAWRKAVKLDWGRTPLGTLLLFVMTLADTDGGDNDLFDNAAARSGFATDSCDRYLATRARYNRECLRETVEEPVQQPATEDAHEMSALPELSPWQTAVIGALSLIPAIKLMSWMPTPTLSPSMGSGFISSHPHSYFSSSDGGA